MEEIRHLRSGTVYLVFPRRPTSTASKKRTNERPTRRKRKWRQPRQEKQYNWVIEGTTEQLGKTANEKEQEEESSLHLSHQNNKQSQISRHPWWETSSKTNNRMQRTEWDCNQKFSCELPKENPVQTWQKSVRCNKYWKYCQKILKSNCETRCNKRGEDYPASYRGFQVRTEMPEKQQLQNDHHQEPDTS